MESKLIQFTARLKTQLAGQIIATVIGLVICILLYNAFAARSQSISRLIGLEKVMMVVRVIHIVAGCLTLFTGLGAILSRKGGKVHLTHGKIYFWNMAIIFVTGVMMAFYTNNIFFFFIGFVSFYPAFIGNRILKQKRLFEGEKATWYDKLINYSVFLVAIYGLYLGFKNITEVVGILLLIFNSLLINHGISVFRIYKNPPKFKGFWLILHITEMSGSFVAAVTAFLVNNSKYFEMISPIILWVSPGVIGGLIIAYVARKKKREMKMI